MQTPGYVLELTLSHVGTRVLSATMHDSNAAGNRRISNHSQDRVTSGEPSVGRSDVEP